MVYSSFFPFRSGLCGPFIFIYLLAFIPLFELYPGADASLCGMVATGASGTNAVRYGTMLANTRNLQVVMADGSLVHTAGPGVRTRKSSAGYNLTSLMVGSEGTLGLITEATLQLHGLPEMQLSAVCSFPSVRAAVDTTIAALQCSLPVARIEFLDEVALEACNKYSGLTYDVLPTLFLEFHGSEAEVKAQAKFLAEISKEFGGGDFLWAVETEARSQLWKARHDLFYASLALQPGSRSVVTDVAVPISRLPDLVEQAQVLIQDANLIGPMLGHVGDGNFHTLLLFDPREPSQLQAARGVADSLARLALSMSGTVTGEHGIGLGKLHLLEEELGAQAIHVMRTIKSALDPLGIMNPGKVLLARGQQKWV